MNLTTKRVSSLLKKITFNMVQSQIANTVGLIYLNSQKDLNALSSQMRSSISRKVREYQADPGIKVMVLLSKVQKAFCAGANIKEFQNKTSKDFENNDVFKQIHDTIYNAKKPIIAGVNGVALGGGFQLALLCDVIFCSDNARFGLPQLQLGLIPGIGGTQRLARIAGKVNAMRYILTSEFIAAEKAKELGVVSQVYRREQLHHQVIAMAHTMASKPSTALIAAKQCIKEAQNLSMKDGVALERKLFFPLYDTKGMKEGVDAFINKRKPEFDHL